MDITLPKRSTGKGNKNRKYGRNSRKGKHRIGTLCSMRNCDKLRDSRYFDPNLRIWLSTPIRQRERVQTP